MKEIEQFIAEWKVDALGVKPAFDSLYKSLQQYGDIKLEFYSRPGISHSLRAIHKAQKKRPLFVMIDVIDDDPQQRWLSVCFLGDAIEDPEELGDLIPEGLLGNDGYCFDVNTPDANLREYIGQRIREAYDEAGGG